MMDLLSLPMEVPMPRIPWMEINHHEVWPSRGTFEWWHLQIISSPGWNEKMRLSNINVATCI